MFLSSAIWMKWYTAAICSSFSRASIVVKLYKICRLLSVCPRAILFTILELKLDLLMQRMARSVRFPVDRAKRKH